MKSKNSQNRTRYTFTKQKASTTVILPTKVIVERTMIGAVEHINVIDAEVVRPTPVKRPSFLISETIVKAKKLWKGK